MFRTLTSRMFAILAVGLLTIQIVSFAGFMAFRGMESRDRMMRFLGADTSFIVEFMRSLSPEGRTAWLPRLNRGYYRISLETLPGAGFTQSCPDQGAQDVIELLRKDLPPDTAIACRLRTETPDQRVMQVLLSLDERQGLLIELVDPFAAPPVGMLVLYLLAIFVAIVPFVAWAVRQTTRRTDHMLDTIESFGRNLDTPPVPERGTAELRRAAVAFNTMRERVLKHVEERTQILAAIAHDLQTPLTRLRLRAENVTDNTTRERLVADVDLMGSLVAEGIDYARSSQVREPRQAIEVNHWLEGLVDDFTDTGAACRLEGRALKPYVGALRALTRVMQNLIGNATKYGGGAGVCVEDAPSCLIIRVCDNGPGLPEDLLEKVFEPFYRAEVSRNRETGGSGLGLSIARNLVRAHGGDLCLRNREAGGIEAIVTLPRSAASNG